MKYGSSRHASRITPRHIIAGIVVLALIAGGLWLWQSNDQKAKNAAGQTAPSIQAEKENTEKFEKALQEQKKSGGESVGGSSSNSNLAVANVILAAATTSETRGYVSNVLEDGGTCTATYTKGSTKVTGTSTGFVDVNKTTCAPIPISGLSRGDWVVVLSYKSATASGASQAITLNVQ